MGISLFVVEHSSLLNRLLGDGQINLNRGLWIGRCCAFHRQLEGIEKAARVSVSHIHHVGFGIGSDRDRTIAIAPLFVLKGSMEQLTQIVGFEALQSKQARSTYERFVDFEVRVLSGGTDQGESAVFYPREQRILLSTVEAMDFINKQDGSQAMFLQALLGGVYLLTQVLNAGQNSVQAAELRTGMGGNDPGQSCLPDTRRSVQDQIAHPVCGDRPAQQTAFGEDRVLALKFVE